MLSTFSRAVVVGTGLMAPGIATALADAGLPVTIAGRNTEHARRAAIIATALGKDGIGIQHSNIDAEVFRDVDLVVETIVEDLSIKTALFERIAPWIASSAVITTNTSSLPLDVLADSTLRPNRVAGLHFMNPAHLTSVVEVVAATATEQDVMEQLTQLAEDMGKLPVRVNCPVPGFVWNRIQFAVLRECVHLLENGVTDAASIDAAVADGLATRWTAAGPLATADLGGSSTFGVVALELFGSLADGAEVPGPLGRGEPFYRWDAETREAVDSLRVEALRVGRQLAHRRQRAMPPLRDR